MNWFLILWPMAAAASLTLALLHFGRWLGLSSIPSDQERRRGRRCPSCPTFPKGQ